MRALDLCCKAGGASVGLHRAGFEVVGVDIEPQKNYPYQFIQADALTLPLDFLRGFDLIWASWPCQAHTSLRRCNGDREYPDLIPEGRALLQASGVPYIMENVIGSRLDGVTLCGAMFGLKVYRHRLFESNYLLMQPPHVPHRDQCPGTSGPKPRISPKGFISVVGDPSNVKYCRAAMGIDWMTGRELSQAVPPAYSEYLGGQMYRALQRSAA